MKLAILQIKVTGGKDTNLKKVKNLYRDRKTREADFVVLPEMFNCPYEMEKFSEFAEEIPGRTTDFLAELASSWETYLIGGSIPEKADGKVFNTSAIFNPEGELVEKHRKIHLFSVDYPGRIQVDESKFLEPGDKQTIVDTEFGKVGVAICYDFRFPELLRSMTLTGSKIIFLPAAFNTTTGPAHWKPVLRARAIDNQAFVVAASPARNRASNYKAYGHSIAIDPWGKVLVEAGEGEEALYTDMDLNKIEEVRKRLPLIEDLRPEIYEN